MELARVSQLPSRGAFKVFVGGPIQYAQRPGGSFEPKLRHQFETVIGALEAAGLAVFSAHKEERFGEIDLSGQSAFVVQRDIAWMRSCDLFLSLLPIDPEGRPYRTDGTCIELGWAATLEKPILIILNRRAEYSHLVLGLHAVANVCYLEESEVFAHPESLVETALAMVSRQVSAVSV